MSLLESGRDYILHNLFKGENPDYFLLFNTCFSANPVTPKKSILFAKLLQNLTLLFTSLECPCKSKYCLVSWKFLARPKDCQPLQPLTLEVQFSCNIKSNNIS